MQAAIRARRRPRGAVLLVAAVAAVTLFGDAARAEEAAVQIDDFTFSPPSLTVKAGATVAWRNKEDMPHTVAL
jgi:plastocyanin